MVIIWICFIIALVMIIIFQYLNLRNLTVFQNPENLEQTESKTPDSGNNLIKDEIEQNCNTITYILNIPVLGPTGDEYVWISADDGTPSAKIDALRTIAEKHRATAHACEQLAFSIAKFPSIQLKGEDCNIQINAPADVIAKLDEKDLIIRL